MSLITNSKFANASALQGKDDLELAIAELAKTAGSVPGGKSAYAEMIVNTVNPNHLALDVFNTFMPVRQFNPGDMFVRRVRKGVRVRTMVAGVNHLADQFTLSDSIGYAMDNIIAKVRHPSQEVQSGLFGTVEQIRAELASTLIDEIVARTFRLLTSVWSSFNSQSNYLTTSSLAAANVTTMMENVLAQSGSIRAIVGTRRALLSLYEQTAYTIPTGTTTPLAVPSFLEEWRRTGRVTEFRGAPLIELPQILQRTQGNYDTKLIPEDFVLVIGQDAGQIGLFGPETVQEYTDYTFEPPVYSLAVYRSFGLIVDRPENIGVIKIQ